MFALLKDFWLPPYLSFNGKPGQEASEFGPLHCPTPHAAFKEF
jgi:hypothetical protein